MFARLSFIAILLGSAGAMAQGVTKDSVLLGQPAAFSGPSAGLGIELWRGMAARAREVNEAGGISGRKLELALCDDKYDPEQAARCAVDLVSARKVFLLTNTVGTPTIVRILPLLQVWSNDNVLVFGNFTGAKPQRSMPAAPYVFNVRASYEQETATHVQTCVEAGRRRIGTFIQNDAFGKDGEEGVRIAAKSAKAVHAISTSYERGAAATADMSRHIEILRNAGVDCVSTTGSYQAVAAFIRAARSVGWRVPIFAVSFTGADQLMSQLEKTMPAERIVMTQVVPHVDDTRFPLVRDYRAAMDKYRPAVPDGVGDGSYQAQRLYTFGSLEGYLNTRVLTAVLAKAGNDLTRVTFKKAAESLTDLDVGLDKDKVTFAPITGPETVRNHQGLKTVWLTIANGSSWKPVENVSTLARQLVGD